MPTDKSKKNTVSGLSTLKDAVLPVASGLAAAARCKISAGAEQGKSAAEQGKTAAEARLSGAKAAVAPTLADVRSSVEEARTAVTEDYVPRVVDAKDTFIDSTLPKVVAALSSAVATSQVAGSDAVRRLTDSEPAQRAADAAAVLKGDAVVKRKGGKSGFLSGLLGTLAILGTAGAAAWYFNKRAAEQDDPWARPLSDPWVPPSTAAAGTDAASGGQVSEVPAGDHDLIPTGDAGTTGDLAESAGTVGEPTVAAAADPLGTLELDEGTPEATRGPDDPATPASGTHSI